MRMLFLLLSFLVAFQAHAQERVSTALVLATDVSLSVTNERYKLQKEGIAHIFSMPGIGTLVKGGLAVIYVEWSSRAKVMVDWHIIHNEQEAKQFANEVLLTERLESSLTGVGTAIRFSADLFATCPCDPLDKVIDVSGDGPQNFGMDTKEQVERAVAQGMRVNGLAIVTESEPTLLQWYEENVKGGVGSFVIDAQGFDDFEDALRRKLFLEIS